MTIARLYRRNIGGLDRGLRVAAGVMLLPLGIFVAGATRGEAAGIVLAVAGLVALASGLSGRCPGYALAGISTVRTPRLGEGACGCPDDRTAGPEMGRGRSAAAAGGYDRGR